VRVLLDTQCWLWMQAEPDRFRSETRKLLLDPSNELFLEALPIMTADHVLASYSVTIVPP